MPQYKFNNFVIRLINFDKNFEGFKAVSWLQLKSVKLKTSAITSNGLVLGGGGGWGKKHHFQIFTIIPLLY